LVQRRLAGKFWGKLPLVCHAGPSIPEEIVMNRTHFSLIWMSLIAVLALTAVPHVVKAQATGFGSAGWKQGVDNYWPAQASGRYVETARNYAQSVQTYIAKTPQPEPTVVKEIKTELGRYLDDAQKHLTSMKNDFANDKDALAGIEGIEKELATAVKHNKEMIACCEMQTFDKIGAMACCTDLVKELDKVHADHVALMKKLAAKYPAPAAKQ
jgi:hypothetical protein